MIAHRAAALARTLAVALAALTAVGCAAATAAGRRDADRRLASGDAAGAAAAYDALLRQQPPRPGEDLLLFQAATAHALAGLDAGDPSRGREPFEALVTRFPDSPYRPAAELLLRLLDRPAPPPPGDPPPRAEAAGDAAAAGALGELRQTLVDLHRQVDRLVAEARQREEKLRALRDEVEMLKAIDLAPPAEPPH